MGFELLRLGFVTAEGIQRSAYATLVVFPDESRHTVLPCGTGRCDGSPVVETHIHDLAPSTRHSRIQPAGVAPKGRRPLALRYLVRLEDLGLARHFDAGLCQQRHQPLAEGLPLLTGVPDLADHEVSVGAEADVVVESVSRPFEAGLFELLVRRVVLLGCQRGRVVADDDAHDDLLERGGRKSTLRRRKPPGNCCRQYQRPRAKPPNATRPISTMINPRITLQTSITTMPTITRIPPSEIPPTPPRRSGVLTPDLLRSIAAPLPAEGDAQTAPA